MPLVDDNNELIIDNKIERIKRWDPESTGDFRNNIDVNDINNLLDDLNNADVNNITDEDINNFV